MMMLLDFSAFRDIGKKKILLFKDYPVCGIL
jgi:hypothetical protein